MFVLDCSLCNSCNAQAAAKRKKANQSAEAAARAKHRDRRRLIDVIVETIYDCSMYENDKVQLQVLLLGIGCWEDCCPCIVPSYVGCTGDQRAVDGRDICVLQSACPQPVAGGSRVLPHLPHFPQHEQPNDCQGHAHSDAEHCVPTVLLKSLVCAMSHVSWPMFNASVPAEWSTSPRS